MLKVITIIHFGHKRIRRSRFMLKLEAVTEFLQEVTLKQTQYPLLLSPFMQALQGRMVAVVNFGVGVVPGQKPHQQLIEIETTDKRRACER